MADTVQFEVLHHSNDYIIINKPAHCVMDGDHACTVEGIVKAKFPQYKKLFWVHQLDAETSGVLCIALNHIAASAACKLFQSRQVYKEYLCIVYGHVQPPTSRDVCNEARTPEKKMCTQKVNFKQCLPSVTNNNNNSKLSSISQKNQGEYPERKKARCKKRKNKRGPSPDFCFFDRDRKKALAKQENLAQGDKTAKLTDWEARLVSTKKWKAIKHLSDDQSDMVRLL